MNALLAALFNSCRGFAHAVRTERAVRQETVLLVVGLPGAAVLASSLWVFAALVGALLAMIAVELLNTAVEKLCDHVTPDRHPAIGRIKDVASAAALFSQALAALIWVVAAIEAWAK